MMTIRDWFARELGTLTPRTRIDAAVALLDTLPAAERMAVIEVAQSVYGAGIIDASAIDRRRAAIPLDAQQHTITF
jgi:hypothetical protein